MSRCFHRNVLVCSLAVMFALTGQAFAQVMDAGTLYSQGLHAYFAGQSSQADEFLSRALALDPQDPRAHYFRGLVRLRQGRGQEARVDMQIGASVEAQQPGRHAVGAALERVQGSGRLLLEQFRREGRLAETGHRAERDRLRYEQVLRRESEVLHRRATISLDQLMNSNGGRPTVVLERSRPPIAASRLPARPAAVGASAAVSSDNPFPDDPAAPGPAGAQRGAAAPFATSAGAPPASEAGVDDNPFGLSASTGGTGSTPTPTAAVSPAPTTPAGADVDPFRSP